MFGVFGNLASSHFVSRRAAAAGVRSLSLWARVPPIMAMMQAMTESQRAGMVVLRRAAQNKQIDLTNAFEEYAGTGRLANLGIMTKHTFTSAMGIIFNGIKLTPDLLRAICLAYAAGDPDVGEPGTYTMVRFKQFAIDFDDVALPADSTSDFGEVLADPQLYKELQNLRLMAQNRKLDLTDAFEEYAGTGREANLGLMAKNRFRAAMGTMFQGINLSSHLLDKICNVYNAGDPDPREPGTWQKVFWKQFAIDFDNIPIPVDALSDFEEVLADPQLYKELRTLRAAAQNKQLDLTDAFEEFSGTGREANLGIMQKNRFRAAMGTMFTGIKLSARLLDKICAVYNAGDPDPREPGTCQKVLWKQFAIDFDKIPLPPGPEKPDPTPAIIGAMRDMNIYADRNGMELEKDFTNYLGPDAARFDVIPRVQFKKALGVVLGTAASLYQLNEQMLENICNAYGAGEPLPHRPQYREGVQWREFVRDVRDIQAQPWLEKLMGDDIPYLDESSAAAEQF